MTIEEKDEWERKFVTHGYGLLETLRGISDLFTPESVRNLTKNYIASSGFKNANNFMQKGIKTT